MADTRAPQTEADGRTEEDRLLEGLDWEAIERSPEFQELVHKRRGFVIPGTIFFLSYYMAFILLCGYAPDFMAESVYEGLTVGYTLALTQFLMVFTLGIMYLRRADKDYDPLAAKVVEQASRSTEGTGRFARSETGARAATDREVTR